MGNKSFWADASEEHQQLAKEVYQNIEITHPQRVSSRGMCPCLDYSSSCPWATTKVTYYNYQGPHS